jgi:tetratricopeptide (TPR) repeat protein
MDMTKLSKHLLILTFFLWFTARGMMPAHANTLDDDYKNYLSGEYEEIVKAEGDGAANEQSLYILGLTYLKTAEYIKARQTFEKLIAQFPDSPARQRVMFKIADTYFLEGSYPRAISTYKDIEQKQRDGDLTALLTLRFAQIAAKEGKWEDKDKYTALIKTKYPGSPEEKYAKRLDDYGDFFTIQIGAFDELKNALQMKRGLQKKFDPYTVQETRNGVTLYKIRIGRFRNRQDAEKVAVKLREEGYPAKIYP